MTSMPASRRARAMIFAPAVVTVQAGLGHDHPDLAIGSDGRASLLAVIRLACAIALGVYG